MAEGIKTFHLFPKLPPEVRRLIWTFGFHDYHFEPALFTYTPDLWVFSEALDLAEDHNNTSPQDATDYLDFRSEFIHRIGVTFPLTAVNYEARNLVISQVEQFNLPIVPMLDSNSKSGCVSAVFLRAFNPDRDMLYVGCKGLREFVDTSPALEPDSLLITCDIQRIAVPVTLILDPRFEDFLSILQSLFSNLEELIFIIDREPEMSYVDNTLKFHRAWTVTEAPASTILLISVMSEMLSTLHEDLSMEESSNITMRYACVRKCSGIRMQGQSLQIAGKRGS